MATKEALIIEGAYLESEDAPGLDDVLVYVGENTVDLTTHRGNALTLEFEDLAAINRKVQIVKAAITSGAAALGAALPVTISSGLRGLYERARQVEENRAAAGLKAQPEAWQPHRDEDFAKRLYKIIKEAGSDNITPEMVKELIKRAALETQPWQPDWSKINPKIKFITRDGDTNQVWAWEKRPRRADDHWREGNGHRLYGFSIPNHVDWTILHERPEPSQNVTYNINITNASPVVEETLKKALEPEQPSPDELAFLGTSWADVPAKYNYVAADRNGEVWGYGKPPNLGIYRWYGENLGCKILSKRDPNSVGDWKESLRIRPSAIKEVLGVTWDEVNPMYNFVAADETGLVFAYAKRPEHDPEHDKVVWFRQDSDNTQYQGYGKATLPSNLSWRNTLFVRPGYTETQP